MRTKFKSIFRAGCHSFGVVCAVALVLQFGVLAGSAQTGQYLFTGSETTITLNPGTYDITAYGAQGGANTGSYGGGLGAEMEGQFSFSASTILTLLVGGSGGGGSFYYMGGPGETSSSGTAGVSGGSGGSGGGGSIIDSSAIMDLAEVSGIASPDDSPNGEIIITAVPEPTTLALVGLSGLSLILFRRRRK